MALFDYMKQVQRFLRDSNQTLVDPEDIRAYINMARREVAMRAQAIRFLTPISGPIATLTIAAGGTGYTAPTLTISPPDSPSGFLPNPLGLQATATCTQSGGVINTVSLTVAGSGYISPQVTVNDPTGSGATVTASVTGISTLNGGQEQYPFSAFPLPSGVKEVYTVQSISVIFSNYRYSLPVYSMSVYQARIRQFVASQYLYIPSFAAQLGRGASGTLFMYPPPSQQYPVEFQCAGIPVDLTADTDAETIPDPWTDLVPYYAAHLAMLELQNANTARMYLELFEKRMADFGRYALPGRMSNPYGRW